MKTIIRYIKRYWIPVVFCVAAAVVLLVALCGGGGHKQHTIRSPKDLRDAVVGVQLGTTSDMKVSALEKQSPSTRVERYTKTADAVQALLQGKIDCVVEDEQPAKAFVSRTAVCGSFPNRSQVMVLPFVSLRATELFVRG